MPDGQAGTPSPGPERAFALDSCRRFRLVTRMFLSNRTIAAGLALLSLPAFAADEPVPLTKEEMAAAARTDDFSMPTPGEFISALGKTGKFDWKAKYRVAIPTTFTSRPQMALNLGTLIADGYIAVEAEDAQSVKNIGKDIMALAKPLGVKEKIVNRGKTFADFADDGKWDQLKEELEATQNEVKAEFGASQDKPLIALVTAGGWARATEVIAAHIGDHYSDDLAKLLRQPGIVGYLNERLDALPEKLRSDPAVKLTRAKMTELQAAVSFSREAAPTKEEVKKINELAAKLVKDISRRDLK